MLATAPCLQSLQGVRFLLATLLVAGCSFDHGVVEDQPDAGQPGDPTPDSDDPATTLACKYPDGALRLCIEFEDHKYTPTTSDASPYQLNAVADEIGEWARDGQPAAATYWNTDVRVPESPMLDIADAITFETWVRVPVYQYATILANDGQYGITMDGYGRVTCHVGSASVTSDPIGTDVWRHVACSYDHEILAVHIDGDTQRCDDEDSVIPTSGTTGTRIAPGFTAAIDDIHVYARALSAAEICSHANKTACSSSCSGGGYDGGGGSGGGGHGW